MTTIESVPAAAVLEPVAPADPQTRPRRSALRTAGMIGLLVLVAVETVLVWPYVAHAAGTLSDPDPWWMAVAVGAEILSMGAFARVQRRMLSTGGTRVPMRRMISLTYAANAVSVTFPGGTALSAGYMFRRFRRWGATAPAAGFAVLASGVLSAVSFVLLAVTCAVVAGTGGTGAFSVIALLAALALLALVGRHTDGTVRIAGRVLGRVNRITHRAPDAGLSALQRFVTELSAIRPRGRDWLAGLGFAAMNWIADLACLAASCQAVGAQRSTIMLVLVAYVAGMGASSVSFLPGGFGVVDVAMVVVLTHGGVGTVAATAGVLLYRLISFALVVALGWIVWALSWWADRTRGQVGEPVRTG